MSEYNGTSSHPFLFAFGIDGSDIDLDFGALQAYYVENFANEDLSLEYKVIPTRNCTMQDFREEGS